MTATRSRKPGHPSSLGAERLRGLKPAQAQQLRRAMQLLASGDRLYAAQLLLDLARSAPDHPEVLRCCGIRHFHDGEYAQAADFMSRANAARPGDVAALLQLSAAQEHAGQHATAWASLRSAAGEADTAADWLALSIEFDRQAYFEDAFAAVQRAVEIDPRQPVARLQRARCATALGHADIAAADCRTLIARQQLLARAWFMLGDLKVVPLSTAELAGLERTAAEPPATMTADDRVLLQFALGKALEDAGRVDDAFAALRRANGLAGEGRPWDAAAFSRDVASIGGAFEALSAPVVGNQGREVIFLVGLPRSGTTLTEQILASHSQVEGASELPYLGQVIQRESRRSGKVFPQWVNAATPDDWARLGREYLTLSARWRTRRPVSTDKLPENWLYAGAALHMLPGARFIDCRRDPVETCWSCYKQLFGPGMVPFTYGFHGLAAYWRDYRRLTRLWTSHYPGRFITQQYEQLVAEPEPQIRALLDACGLSFEPGCLAFHEARRAIRTPSAMQVRQPLRQASTPAARYGALLDPLRRLLADA